MKKATDLKSEMEWSPRSPYDPEPPAEEDLWFLPALDDDAGPPDMPWPVAPREASLEPDVWRAAEKECYRDLLVAVQAVTRFGERLRHFSKEVCERFALDTVSSILRGEGIWIGPEQIALYRTLRLASGEQAQDLTRANWAVRRLLAAANPREEGLHGFLGRTEVDAPKQVLGEERPLGGELTLLSENWARGLDGLFDCHALTQSAFGFALWRREGITPYEELLEPTIAALTIGTGEMAPILPMAQGHRLDRHTLKPGSAGAEARLKVFYEAVEAGALAATLELDRLATWQERTHGAIADLSGRTPPRLVKAMLKARVVSAEWLAAEIGCSPASARRNLKVFEDRGLVREVTGQERYKFWTVAP